MSASTFNEDVIRIHRVELLQPINAQETFPRHCLLAGTKLSSNLSNQYVNHLEEPFSFFFLMHRLSSRIYLPQEKQTFIPDSRSQGRQSL